MKDGDAYKRGLEDAARIAEFFSIENSRLAMDTWMVDPIRRGSVSLAAQSASQKLQAEGVCCSAMAIGTGKVAILIRQQMIDGPDAGLASVLRHETVD